MNKSCQSCLLGRFPAAIFGVITILPSHAALISVLGGQAFYDDQLDITWTANADINGPMDWATASTWAVGLTIDGVSGWRLPNMDINGDGTVVECGDQNVAQAVCQDNELGHFAEYGAGTTLGTGVGNGISVFNPGPFSNVSPTFYWSSTEHVLNPANVWGVSMFDTFQFNIDKSSASSRGWAVHSGNVGAVPIPAAVWLFCSGLIGLIGIAKRGSAA